MIVVDSSVWIAHLRNMRIPAVVKLRAIADPLQRQSASFTLIGPSLLMFRCARQSTLARAASIVTLETLLAVMSSVSLAGSEAAGSQALLWLVYGIAGI